MVVLENIQENKGKIECDYNPEMSGLIGHIILENGEVHIERESDFEKSLKRKMYSWKAGYKLKQLAEAGSPLPSIAAVIWY